MLESKQILTYDDPSKTFLGVRFLLLGFDSVKEDKVRSKLLEGGGIDAVNYGPDCNYVIVDKLVYDDPVCIAARRDGKTLVTGLWVDHCFDVGMPVDPTSVMYRPLRDLNGIPGAKSLVVCLTGYQRQDRDDIMTMVALMGATFSKPLVANKVTHLICYKFEGEKYELAKKMRRIIVVNHRWLEDCLKAWELLPEADYIKSGYELEMEAEAKDSEEETEDMALTVDMGRRIVASPQNTRVENKSFHQSPVVKQEIPRNSSYLSATKSLTNVGDISKILPTPGKEIDFQKTLSFSRETRDKHLDMSSARSPGKMYSEVPSNMHHGTMISEKVDNVLASASESSKKSPSACMSKSSSKTYSLSSPKKSSLPLRSERIENIIGGPSSSNVSGNGVTGAFDMASDRHQNGTDSDGMKTPSKGTSLHLDEEETVKLASKRKMTRSRGSSKSPMLNNDPKPLTESELATKTTKVPASGSSVDVSHGLRGDASPATVTRSLRKEASMSPKEALKSSVTLATKTTKVLASGSPVSRVLPGDASPATVTRSLRKEASISPKEALKTSVTSEDRQECDDHTPQRSPEGLKKGTLLNVDAKDLSLSLIDNCTGEAEMHQNDLRSVESPSLRTNPGAKKIDDQAGLNFSEVGHTGAKLKPLKRKMLAKKTLGSRPSICKASTTKHKGSINLQKAVLQNESTIHSNGTVSMEDVDNATITEKVVIVPPTSGEDPVDDQMNGPDDEGKNEFDLGSNNEKSAELEAHLSGKGDIHKKKQPDSKITQVAKSVGVKNRTKAEKAVCSKKTELSESKYTGDAGEKKITKGKKRPLVKSKANNKKDPIEEVTKDGTKSKQDEKKTISDNEETAVLVAKTRGRPSKKLKGSADAEKENEPTTIRQQCMNNVTKAAGKVDFKPHKKLIKDSSKADQTTPHSMKVIQNLEVKTEPAWFILSGHKLQRKEFQQVIKRLKGRVCRVSHHWSYQATHFIVPDPVKRTEKFFAAAASGSWILKTDYLTASNEAGKFLPEEPYEWHKKCLTEDGAINLEAPRKWRLLRERTGHGAFYGMQIVIYGECIAPSLDTLKRAVKAGDGTILATSPPYTRFLQSRIDFAIVSPGMPRVDMWVQEFLRHEVPCVVADYLVDYVCKPGYPLEKHVQYNTHAWAQKSMQNLANRVEEVDDDQDVRTPQDDHQMMDDVACQVCGRRDRADEMLICGDESGGCGCGVGTHFDCLDPPLLDVPEDDWFCAGCCQKRERKSVGRKSKKRASKSKK